ncbi:MAG TPA: hypothetical protein VI282_02730 [Verrucomicrobiae bacterium]
MKRLLQIIVLIAAAAAGYFLWIWTHPSPEKAIRKQMEKLAETLVGKPGEGNFARVAGINKTLSFFTSNIYINGEGIPQVNESIQGQTELQQALFAARSRLDGAITFNEIQVVVGPESTNAHVNFHAVARVSGQTEPYSQDLKAEFVKVDGKWLISRVDPIVSGIR